MILINTMIFWLLGFHVLKVSCISIQSSLDQYSWANKCRGFAFHWSYQQTHQHQAYAKPKSGCKQAIIILYFLSDQADRVSSQSQTFTRWPREPRPLRPFWRPRGWRSCSAAVEAAQPSHDPGKVLSVALDLSWSHQGSPRIFYYSR